MQLGFGFFSKTANLFTEDELKTAFKNESKFFTEYCITNWLERYFLMKATARKTFVPNINNTISDMPRSVTNEFYSKTESAALKSFYAEEWLDYFHENLELLPDDYQRLIEYKYLTRRSDGEFVIDEIVMNDLYLSNSKYYEMKKRALEEFGRLLYGYEE